MSMLPGRQGELSLIAPLRQPGSLTSPEALGEDSLRAKVRHIRSFTEYLTL